MALEQTLRTWTAGLVVSAAAVLSGCGTTSQSQRPEDIMNRGNSSFTQVYQPPTQSYAGSQPVMTTGPDGRPMLANEAHAARHGGIGPSRSYDREGNYLGGRVHVDK